MEKLNNSCANINSLEIRLSDMKDINGEFPATLEELKLLKCEIRLDQFKNLKFNCLKCVDISASTRACASHIKDLEKFSHTLKKLVLKKCYRIDDKAIEVIVEGNFDNLEWLDLEETSVTSVGVHLICTKLKDRLNYINVKNCKFILESDVKFLENTFMTNEFFKLEK